jgi:hypothetical protein
MVILMAMDFHSEIQKPKDLSSGFPTGFHWVIQMDFLMGFHWVIQKPKGLSWAIQKPKDSSSGFPTGFRWQIQKPKDLSWTIQMDFHLGFLTGFPTDFCWAIQKPKDLSWAIQMVILMQIPRLKDSDSQIHLDFVKVILMPIQTEIQKLMVNLLLRFLNEGANQSQGMFPLYLYLILNINHESPLNLSSL